MLTRVADGVLVHESEFLQSNAVVVQGAEGVLLIDPGITTDELAGLANDLRELGQPVVAGFSTHPHWDHLLWHAGFGDAPRFGTERCAAAIGNRLATPGWEAMVAGMLPPEIADRIPVDERFGRIGGLPAGPARFPWDGPGIRIIEHDGHAPGHAALLVEDGGVLIAGDMLSDVLEPMLNPFAPDPAAAHLEALTRFEELAGDVKVLVPGHGSVTDAAGFVTRIRSDRAYVEALPAGGTP